jgi:diguanylate cyclase (GGDEF)-like protein/PAS domain S-box-containing protein
MFGFRQQRKIDQADIPQVDSQTRDRAVASEMAMAGKRRTDSILRITQDNANKALIVQEGNDNAEKLFGLSASQIVGKDIRNFVSEHVSQTIQDMMDFKETGRDLAYVLNRTSHFMVKNSAGYDVPLEIKAIRVEPHGTLDCFEIIMRDMTIRTQMEETRKRLQENLKGFEVIDEHSGVPNRTSFLKDLEMVAFYINSGKVNAGLAVISVDNYEDIVAEIGLAETESLLRQIGESLRKEFREDDAVGSLSDREFGAILFEVDRNTITLALNRLRSKVAAVPFQTSQKDIRITISCGHTIIPNLANIEEIIINCQKALTTAQKQGGNRIVDG